MNPFNYLKSLLNRPGQGNMPDGTGAIKGNMPGFDNPVDNPTSTANPLLGRAFRPAPFKNEDEFAAWKTAKLNGTPTQYGKIAQAQYDNRMFPQLAGKYTAALDALKKGWGY